MSYQELLQLTERFLLQQDEHFVLLDKETHFLADDVKERPKKAQVIAPPPQKTTLFAKKEEVPLQAPTPKPLPKVHPEPKMQPKMQIVQPQNLKPQGIPKGISCLPRPFPCHEEFTFDDLKSKLKHVHFAKEKPEDSLARQIADNWKTKVPKMVMLSFFPKNSAKLQFIESIHSAIESRLGSCRLYHLPDLETLAEIYIFAQHALLQACFLASDVSTQSKANEFLIPLNLDEEQRNNELFNKRSILYETPLFDITVSDTLAGSAEEKRLLWNAIKQVAG